MIISIDHRPIAPRILIVGGIRAKTMWQYLLDSRGTNDHFWSWKYIGIQGVEYDQEDGVVPDLEGIVYERIVERKHRLRTQKVNVPNPRLYDWEDVSSELDRRRNIVVPKNM